MSAGRGWWSGAIRASRFPWLAGNVILATGDSVADWGGGGATQ
jgi:hypothetical protein